MKRILYHKAKYMVLCAFLLFICNNKVCAQYEHGVLQERLLKEMKLSLESYPYNKVLESLGNPDTFLFIHYPLTKYRNEPQVLELFLFFKDSVWRGASLICYSNHPSSCYIPIDKWELTKPRYLFSDFSARLDDLIKELDNVDYSYEMSLNATEVFVKIGTNINVGKVYGNIMNFFYEMPVLSYLFTVGYFESFNSEIINTYKLKNKKK